MDFKFKIKIKHVTTGIVVIMLMAYVIFSSLLSVIISSPWIRIAIEYSGLILLLSITGIKRKIKKDDIFMVAFVILLSLQLFLRGTAILYDYLILMPFLVIVIFGAKGSKWFPIAYKVLMISEICFAISTIITKFIPSLYYSTIVPLYPMSSATLIQCYETNRLAGLTSHYSTNGILLATGTIVLFTYLHRYKQKKRMIDIFFLCVMVVALLLTGKRGPLLFCCAALFFTYYFSMGGKKKNKWLNMLAAMIVVLILGFVIITLMPDLGTVFSRFSDSDDVSMGRFNLWDYAIDIFRRNPIFGIGWRKYRELALIKFGKEFDVHNIYLQLLCETGIIGFGIFILLAINCIRNTYIIFRYKMNENVFGIESMLVEFSLAYQIYFLLYGFTGSPLYTTASYIPYFFAIAICAYYKNVLFKKI